MGLLDEASERSAESLSESESWANAKRIAGSLGNLPPSFTVVVRSLVADHLDYDRILRPVNKFQVSRLFKVPSFKALLYYATVDLKTEELVGRDYLSVGDLVGFFQPLDLAALIYTFVLSRKSRRLIGDIE